MRRTPARATASFHHRVTMNVYGHLFSGAQPRLTEQLDTGAGSGERHKLLMMLDEFPALGRMDFFETSLAFMAGYGIRAYLIAQSLNQIAKAYGENNAILDNCHVRIAFAANESGLPNVSLTRSAPPRN